MKGKYRISIILPAYNEEKYIEECLKSLSSQTVPRSEYEIIVVDNGSLDNTLEISRKFSDQTLSFPVGNVGAVRNYGAKKASAETILFIDSDCLVTKDWLEHVIAKFKGKDNFAYGAPLILPNQPTWIEQAWLLPSRKTQNDLMGSCFLIDKVTFLKVQGFPEDMESGEDTHLSKVLKRQGVDVDPTALPGIIHLGNAKSFVEFYKRQVWHAKSYKGMGIGVFKDPVLILSLVMIITPILAILSFIIDPKIGIILAIISIIIPVLHSLKRIHRSNLSINVLATIFHKIYMVDLLYLVSRGVGYIIRNQ